MVSNTGASSPGEPEMTFSTSDVAACRSKASARCTRASASSRVRASSCFFNSISELGPLLTRALAFVPVERSRVGLFAPLRAKVTSSAQSLGLPILTHDELAAVAVGTCVASHAPRTEPYGRLSRIRLPPRVCDGQCLPYAFQRL